VAAGLSRSRKAGQDRGGQCCCNPQATQHHRIGFHAAHRLVVEWLHDCDHLLPACFQRRSKPHFHLQPGTTCPASAIRRGRSLMQFASTIGVICTVLDSFPYFPFQNEIRAREIETARTSGRCILARRGRVADIDQRSFSWHT